MQHATGDLRLIINELDIATLTDEQGDEKVAAHVKDAFQEYLEKQLPKAIERAIFAPECRRSKQESMLQYIARKRFFFRN